MRRIPRRFESQQAVQNHSSGEPFFTYDTPSNCSSSANASCCSSSLIRSRNSWFSAESYTAAEETSMSFCWSSTLSNFCASYARSLALS